MIMIIKEEIKKSFFDILPPPSYFRKRHHPTKMFLVLIVTEFYLLCKIIKLKILSKSLQILTIHFDKIIIYVMISLIRRIYEQKNRKWN